MVSHTSLNITVVVSKDTLLTKLRENRAQHRGIIAETRAGYFKKAKEVLEKKLKELEDSEDPSRVCMLFQLEPPMDHTEDFDTAISTLSMHEEETIELTAEVIQMYVENKWPWRRQFLAVNSAYSEIANSLNG